MSAAASLTSITLLQLDFTANCSNLALGVQVWNNFLYGDDGGYCYALKGTATTDSEAVNDGPGGPDGDFPDFWTNGTAPDWIAFWRATLGAKIPDTYLSLTDNDIANWANNTDMFDFFVYPEVDPRDPPAISQGLDMLHGCNDSFSKNITDLIGMEVSCITRYCCSSTTNSTITNQQHSPFPYYPNWTIGDACGFHTCEQANKGNPDLGGIGVCSHMA